MRLCSKLLAVTRDPIWADRLEKTFYNAYLASMSPNADKFAAYTPLMGYRSAGHHHCRTHTDCCNANGPRGWLTVLDSTAVVDGGAATLNFYMSGKVSFPLPACSPDSASFSVYTMYPRDGTVFLRYCGREAEFSLNLRIPAFSEQTRVKVNGRVAPGAAQAGSYFTLTRAWKSGDTVEVAFELPVKMHRLHDHVAFTRGPICLARDVRFGDGALDDEVQAGKITEKDLAEFKVVKRPDPSMFMAVAAVLPTGIHTENPDNGMLPSVVQFTDYASAGNLWRPDCRYRVWLPDLIPGRAY